MHGRILVFEVLLAIVILAGGIYIAVRFTQASMDCENKLWRSKVFMAFSSVFMILLQIVTFITGFHIYSSSAAGVVVTYTAFNFYVIAQQWLWKFQDNGLSLLRNQKQ